MGGGGLRLVGWLGPRDWELRDGRGSRDPRGCRGSGCGRGQEAGTGWLTFLAILDWSKKYFYVLKC